MCGCLIKRCKGKKGQTNNLTGQGDHSESINKPSQVNQTKSNQTNKNLSRQEKKRWLNLEVVGPGHVSTRFDAQYGNYCDAQYGNTK